FSFVAGREVLVGAVGGVLLMGGPLLLTHLVSPAGMGFGDVKAGSVLGGALGLVNAQLAMLALLIGLVGTAGFAVVRRRRAVALGPGLVGGALVALTIGRAVGIEANPWR